MQPWCTCVLTVPSPSTSSSAISALVRPRPTRSPASHARPVRSHNCHRERPRARACPPPHPSPDPGAPALTTVSRDLGSLHLDLYGDRRAGAISRRWSALPALAVGLAQARTVTTSQSLRHRSGAPAGWRAATHGWIFGVYRSNGRTREVPAGEPPAAAHANQGGTARARSGSRRRTRTPFLGR